MIGIRDEGPEDAVPIDAVTRPAFGSDFLVRHYSGPIIEDGIQLRDVLRLAQAFDGSVD